MASRLLLTLHVFLLLEATWAKLSVSEDLGADAPLDEELRVFTHEGAKRDMVSINMFKVYEKYSKEPQSQREGNTVRSFKAVPSEW